MDALDRADALLSRAQARGRFVVTPESATSPMDAATTMQIPREVVRGADLTAIDPDATTIISDSEIREHDDSQGSGHHLAERDQTLELPVEDAAAEADDTEAADLEPAVEEEELDGLIPTTTQRVRSTVARRLDG